MEANAATERLSWTTSWCSPIHHPLKPNLPASGMGLFTQTAHLWQGGVKLFHNQMLQSQSESLTKVAQNQIDARAKQRRRRLTQKHQKTTLFWLFLLWECNRFPSDFTFDQRFYKMKRKWSHQREPSLSPGCSETRTTADDCRRATLWRTANRQRLRGCTLI